jgi:PleD family two-component response regulator
MLSKADFYLYEAKKSGKNCVVTQNIFEPQELV